MTKSVTFTFTHTISWEPEDFDCADPEYLDAYNNDTQLIECSKDNLIDCMRDWVSDGGPLEDDQLVDAFVHPFVGFNDPDVEEKFKQHVLLKIRDQLNIKLGEMSYGR